MINIVKRSSVGGARVLALAALLVSGPTPAAGPYPYAPQSYGQQPFYPQPWGYQQQPGAPGPWSYRPPRQPSYQAPAQGAPAAQPNGAPTQGYSYSYSYSTRNSGPPVINEQSRSYSQPQSPGYGQPGSYGQPNGRQATQAPRVEEELSNRQPYAQESVLYTVLIVSSENLTKVDVELPKSDAVIFKQMDGPTASVRTRGGRQEIVNQFRYALIPLHSGNFSLPSVAVRGTLAGAPRGYATNPGEREFEVRAARGQQLQVRPPAPGVQPWLPLQHLALQTELVGAEQPEEGKPFTLIVRLTAVGATGSRLPSLEKQLRSGDFRIYREKTLTTGEISPDGRYLQGVREEHYTLVPQYGGKLQLPELRIGWWNVNTDNLQHVTEAARALSSTGGARSGGWFRFSGADGLFLAGSSSVFWVPLAAIFGLLAGYWLAVWLRGGEGVSRPTIFSPLWLRLRVLGGAFWRLVGPKLGRLQAPLAEMGRSFARGAEEFRVQTREQLAKLSPAPHWYRARRAVISTLPAPLRFWLSVRWIGPEDSPEAWTAKLKSAAYPQLGLSPQAPLAAIPDRLQALQPSRDWSELRRLVHTVDGAIYGGKTIDFSPWRQTFIAQLRPRLAGTSRIRTAGRRGLPALNPTPA